MRKNKLIPDDNAIKILAVDDDPTMTLTIASYFTASGYIVETENSPERAVERVRNEHFDIMLLDFLMSPICGDKVVSAIREFNDELFIILLTGHKSLAPPIKTIRALNIQGYFEKSEKFDQLELLIESCVKSIKQIRTITEYRDSLARVNEQLNEAKNRLERSYSEMTTTLRSIVDARDIYTRGHSDRVAYLARRLSAELGRSEGECSIIHVTGLFHDIGKIKIPDSILLKEGILTEEEFAVMRRHPEYAVDILNNVSGLAQIIPAVRSHHERYDGKGYPQGLRGLAIPIDARIIALTDSYDAMTSYRRYRSNIPPDEALDQIMECAGTQFDPELAECFVKMMRNRADWEKTDPDWISIEPAGVIKER